jgi:hypothetical protein
MVLKPSTNGSIPMDARIVPSNNQISCELENEAVVLNLEEGVYYGLNPVAARVWELVQQSKTVREIRDCLLAEYDIEEATCTNDLLDLLRQLHRWQLIEVAVEKAVSPR